MHALGLLRLLTAVCLSIAAGCQSTTGQVSGGRYTAPEELFSLPVPRLGPGLDVEDGISTNPDNGLRSGFVSFHDDFGNVRSITYEEAPADWSRPEGSDAQDMLRDCFREACLPQ